MVGVGRTVNTLATGTKAVSKKLVFSYVIDWILIIGIAALGGGFSKIQGAKHAFSLDDPNISFPYHDDTVTVAAVLITSVIAPAVIIVLICLILVPGPLVHKTTPSALIWRRKVWEWNAGWMGLGLALASAFMITEGLKDLAGKPRPHLLAVCQPDTSPAAIQRYRVGGLGESLDSAVPIMVDYRICTTTDAARLRDAFASWPSGHSSFIWSGMLYLTLFVCAKFAVQIPFLSPAAFSRHNLTSFDEEEDLNHQPNSENPVPPRNQAAAPPVYLLIIAFVPIGVAFFVALSRWFDYHHHGFDIISGSLIGMFTAWFAFRWYHLPIRRGTGWAWGARSRGRAFWVNVGIPSYVGDEGWSSAKTVQHNDVENGTQMTEMTGPGMSDRPDTQITNGTQTTSENSVKHATGDQE